MRGDSSPVVFGGAGSLAIGSGGILIEPLLSDNHEFQCGVIVNGDQTWSIDRNTSMRSIGGTGLVTLTRGANEWWKYLK